MLSRNLKGLRGFLIDAPVPGRLRGVRDGAILIEGGLIAASGTFDEVRRAPGAELVRWQHSSEAVLIPGLIDLHAHLPHYPLVALGNEDLRFWLDRHAYPAERQFNAGAARAQAPAFYEALARHGTTCALLHAAASEESCDESFAAAERSGMRIVLGQVLTDEPGHGGPPRPLPPALQLEQSERLCRRWHGRDGGRLEYAFSPRNALACSADLLREAALLARKYGAFFQMHLAERLEEIGPVRARLPAALSATAACDACGLLGDRSIFSHCIHLDASEVRLLAETRSAVVHCPTSNLTLSSGLMPLDQWTDAGLRIGLGSDVGQGPELDLWRVMRTAIESQKARAFHVPGVRVPTPAEVFRLATLGGAEALGKERVIGTLDVGKEADVVALDLARALPGGERGNMHSDLSAEEIVALLVYRGGPQTVIETFVRGTSVHRAPSPLLL